MLLIGAAANRKITAKMLRAFVDKTGIPFITTQMGKGVINEDHPRWLGNAAVSDGDYPHRAIEKADLILNVGHDVVEKPPFMMKTGVNDERKSGSYQLSGCPGRLGLFPTRQYDW